ncbi:LamG domain-containing protein [Mycobacterium sp. DL592]|uniref:LamG domain-containing protein n=1 Tax=Mycobacterium sp. DL592 TaxID=2675524 RepID=UPI00141FA12C|nr:LamG domain-containing protein [Mycobacterium sp. DL592]
MSSSENNPRLVFSDIESGGLFSRREVFRRLGLLGVGASGALVLSSCQQATQDSSAPDTSTEPTGAQQSDTPEAISAVNAADIPWPAGLVAMWDFQGDPEGGNTVTSSLGVAPLILTARGSKVVVKSSTDPGPFGPSLVLDGETVYVKDGEIGALDVTKHGGQVTVLTWINDTADNHDDSDINGMAFRAGSYCTGGPEESLQYGSYFDAIRYITWTHGHYTPHIGAQDGPTPGFASNHDYAASARKCFTGVGQGQWHMEAFTYDGKKITAFIDGLSDVWKAVKEPPPSEPGYTLHPTVDRNPYVLNKPINSSPKMKRFSIGAAVKGEPPEFPGVHFTTGKLGGVAVFDRCLTAEEIMAVRLRTLKPNEPITTYSFEVTSVGAHPLAEIGWSAVAGPLNSDVSAAWGDDYRVSRPSGSPKAFLRKTSKALGAAWVPLTGLSSSQIKSVRFKLLSEKPSASPQRVLVRVGDTWWASDTAYGTVKAHSADTKWSRAESVTHPMRWDPGLWRSVSLRPGSLILSDGHNAAPIPPGGLTAIGFLSEGGDGSVVRITDVEIFPN